MSTIFNSSKPNTPVFVVKINLEEGSVKRGEYMVIQDKFSDYIIIQDNFNGTFLWKRENRLGTTETTETFCDENLDVVPLSAIDKLIQAFQETEGRRLQEIHPFCIIIYVEEKRVLTATINNITIPISIDKMEAFRNTDAIITEKFVYELI